VLHILFVAGLLNHPRLADAVQLQIGKLVQAMRPEGLGMSDFSVTDGDDTAAAPGVGGVGPGRASGVG
jgi:hypothetical protein